MHTILQKIRDTIHDLKTLNVRGSMQIIIPGLLGVALGMAVMSLAITDSSFLPLLDRTERASSIDTAEDLTSGLPASDPRRITIPALGINATFEEPLGLNADRTVEVPDAFETVGWYKHSPTPGAFGPSVILGHVDSREGPAAFYQLKQISIGDRILIERADGTTAVFAATKTVHYNQDGFPRELVYGDIDHAGLRLVTCSGPFNTDSGRYTHNFVVYAELVDVIGTPAHNTDG